MKVSSKKGKISPMGLFYIIYISRIVVCLTSIHSISASEINSDATISYIISMGLTVILSLPAMYCVRKDKSPFDIKWLSFLYFLYFSFTAAINVSRFSYFASTMLNPETQGWVFAIIVCLCAFYGASLGIEALSRFSAFCFILLLIAICSVFLCNIETFDYLNLYPIVKNSHQTMLKNIIVFSSNTSEVALYLCLYRKVNGNAQRHYIRAITIAYLTVFLLLLFIVAVMGNNATLQEFPFYSFFQISKFGSYERLDVLHISFWIMGVFVKAVAMVYCAAFSIQKKPSRKSCFAVSAVVFAMSAVMLKISTNGNYDTLYGVIPFFVFGVAIPLFTLIFKKKNNGDELVKMF